MRAKDFRQKAWSTLSGNWGTMVLITLIVSLITGACGGAAAIGVGAVVLFIIEGPLSLGTAMVNLKLVRNEKFELSNVFDGFKNFVSAFVLALLNGIFVFLWSLLFIIPGIIKSYSYSMSFYILADNPAMDADTARRKSIEMMRGNKWKLFCLDLSFIGWWILCALTFGVLALLVTPYHEAARAEFYQYLLAGKNDFTQHTGAENNGSLPSGGEPLNADEL